MFKAMLVDATREIGGGLGEHEFVWPTSAGDRVTLPDRSGTIGIYTIERVEHDPIPLDRGPYAKPTPSVAVYIRWIEDWYPPDISELEQAGS
jgi:hypothetical protein